MALVPKHRYCRLFEEESRGKKSALKTRITKKGIKRGNHVSSQFFIPLPHLLLSYSCILRELNDAKKSWKYKKREDSLTVAFLYSHYLPKLT
jgi:hypothetical protein